MNCKIKQYRLIFWMGLLSLTSLSCSDWLDVKPKSEIKGDELFKTEQGFEDALTGAYILMTDSRVYGQEMSFGLIEALGQQYEIDPLTSSYNYCMQYDYGEVNVIDRIDGIWSASYNVIANVNNVLKNLKTNGSIVTPPVYDRIKGECLGLRAFLHFDLLRVFGWGNLKNRPELQNRLCIPYVVDYDKEITKQSTLKQVLEYIESDLNEAESLLPRTVSSSKFTFNYYAVLGLQARVALWKGDYVKALKYAGEVIELEENFPWINKLNLETNDLALRDLTCSTEYLFGLYMYKFTEATEKYFEPKMEVVKDNPQYLFLSAEKGRLLFESAGVGSGDYRYSWLHDRSGTKWKFLKYKQTERSTFINRIPLMKKAEFYYTAAECLNETGVQSDREKAIGYLNTVREKRGIVQKLETSLSKDEVQQEIYKEWRKELLLEGQMFFYYKRLGLANIPNTSVLMNDERYMLPLPQAEVEFGGREDLKNKK